MVVHLPPFPPFGFSVWFDRHHGRKWCWRDRRATPLDLDERAVLAQLDLAGVGLKLIDADSDAYKAAMRLVERGIAKHIASGATTTDTVEQWLTITRNDKRNVTEGEGFETKTDAVLAVRDELRQRKERQPEP